MGVDFRLRWLWRSRNTCILGNVEDIPPFKKNFILRRKDEYTAAQEKSLTPSVAGCRKVAEGDKGWCRPHRNWVTLNTDGSFKSGSDVVGAGGLIRDHNGLFLRGFMARRNGSSTFQAELLGVRQGLQLAMDMGCTRLMVECDAKEVVTALKDTNPPVNAWFGMLYRCRNIIKKQGWEVHVKHISREQNKVVDWLVKASNSLQVSVQYLEQPPPDLQNIITTDILNSAIM